MPTTITTGYSGALLPYEQRRANALRTVGGNENDPAFQTWERLYGMPNDQIPTSNLVPYGDLASNTNQFMTGQVRQPYVANLPNYEAMVAQNSGNVLSQLQGQVPGDVVNEILQGAAERGIATGLQGSPNANSALLRSLGLTSIGLQQQGQAGLHQAIADTPVPEIWNPLSLYVPERLAQQERDSALAGQRETQAAAQQQQRQSQIPWIVEGRDAWGFGGTPRQAWWLPH